VHATPRMIVVLHLSLRFVASTASTAPLSLSLSLSSSLFSSRFKLAISRLCPRKVSEINVRRITRRSVHLYGYACVFSVQRSEISLTPLGPTGISDKARARESTEGREGLTATSRNNLITHEPPLAQHGDGRGGGGGPTSCLRRV